MVQKPNSESQVVIRHESLQELSLLLMTIKDIRQLLFIIVQKAVDVMSCDAASLYLKHDKENLVFEIAVNRSLSFPFEKHLVPLKKESIASHVFNSGDSVNVINAYEISKDDRFKFDPGFDSKVGYTTRSILATPLISSHGDIIGVIQLINRKSVPQEPWPSKDPSLLSQMPNFSIEDEKLLKSFAAIAGAGLENAHLYQDIENLIQGFVSASVEAIESRDFATRGHSDRVAKLSVELARKVTLSTEPSVRDIMFSEKQIRELHYAALLHDFGKIGIKEATLLKHEKLTLMQKTSIRTRIDDFKAAMEIKALRSYIEGLLSEGRPPTAQEFAKLNKLIGKGKNEFELIWQDLIELNSPSILIKEIETKKLEEIKNIYCMCCDGAHRNLISEDEYFALSIKKGSLSDMERREIESHVTFTYNFLSKIPWTKDLAGVPSIAFSHHEKLDGTGYPRKLIASNIPDQSRIMTICDIFDALVASDRPYKPAVPLEKALDILQYECKNGKLDTRFFNLFVEAKVYETTLADSENKKAS